MAILSSFGTSDKVTSKKLKEEGCIVTFSLEVPAAQVQDESHNALMRLQQKARLPGFRPGKAPLDMIKKMLGGRVRQEALEGLVEKHMPQALRDLGIRPVATPEISVLSFDEGKPLKIEAKVEVPPQFTPKDYLKIPAKKISYPATDEALNKRLEEIREAHARLERVEEDVVAKDHYVVVDYHGSQNGKPLPEAKGESELVDLSSEQLVEGLSAGLIGLKRGESKDIPVKLHGKDIVLTTTVKEIKRKILPPLDGDLAKDLGFTTLDEFKAKLKEIIEQEGRAKSEEEMNGQIEQALISANKIPLPPSLVESRIEHRMERIKQQIPGTPERWSEKERTEIMAKLRSQSEDELRLNYILSAIAAKEKIEVTEEDLKAEMEKSLERAQTPAEKDNIRKLFQERRQEIEAMLRERKTMVFVREKAAMKDA